MFPGQKTYSIHTKSGSEDFSTITGEVIQNKNNPALWGIRNLSTDSWMCTMPDGTQKNISTNEVVPVFKDINLVFASGLKGEVVE